MHTAGPSIACSSFNSSKPLRGARHCLFGCQEPEGEGEVGGSRAIAKQVRVPLTTEQAACALICRNASSVSASGMCTIPLSQH